MLQPVAAHMLQTYCSHVLQSCYRLLQGCVGASLCALFHRSRSRRALSGVPVYGAHVRHASGDLALREGGGGGNNNDSDWDDSDWDDSDWDDSESVSD